MVLLRFGRTTFQLVKNIGLVLLRFGVAYALFFYLADFNIVQSVILAIVGLCAIESYVAVYKILEKQEPRFQPFWVCVEPNWYLLWWNRNKSVFITPYPWRMRKPG